MSEINYLETDFKPLSGLSYYRLKQFDLDGSSKLALIRSIEFFEEGDLYIFPNPNSGEFSIELKTQEGEEVLVLITDASGKELYSKVWLSKKGEKSIGIDLQNTLAPGLYLITASSKHKFYSSRLLIK